MNIPTWLIDHISAHPDVTDIKFQDGIMYLRTTKGDIDMTQPKYAQHTRRFKCTTCGATATAILSPIAIPEDFMCGDCGGEVEELT